MLRANPPSMPRDKQLMMSPDTLHVHATPDATFESTPALKTFNSNLASVAIVAYGRRTNSIVSKMSSNFM